MCCSLWFLALALLAPSGPHERILTDPHGRFTITVPGSWRVDELVDGAYSQLALFADGPLDISIVVASRPLTWVEKRMTTTTLLDRMIEQTMINTAEVGNRIVQVGRTEDLVDGWPAFAAVATNGDRTKIITTLRTPVRNRAYVVTTITDNLQGSPELGAIVSRIVSSLAIHRCDSQARRHW